MSTVNDVQIRVTGVNTSGSAVKTARKDVAELGDEATKTSAKTVILGHRFDEAKHDAGQLATRLVETKAAMHALAAEFDRTGDFKLIKDFNKQAGELRRLERLAKAVVPSDGSGILGGLLKGAEKAGKDAGEEGAKTFASVFQGGIIDAFKALPPEAKAAVVGVGASIGVVLAAGVGAAVNGALLGAAGGGLLAAGIAAQLKDPHVTNALVDLKAEVQDSFTDATRGFVGPLVYGVQELGHAWNQAIGGIRGSLSDLSKFIVPLSVGLSKLFTNAQPGLLKALDKAGPVLQEIANQLPGLGKAISDAFNDMSRGSDGAVMGISTLFKVLDAGIRIAGQIVMVTSKVYEWFIKAGDAASGFAASVLGWIPGIGKYMKDVHKNFNDIKTGAEDVQDPLNGLSDSADALGGSFSDLSLEAKALRDAFDSLFSSTMGVDEANLHVKQSLDDLKKAFRENGKTLDSNTDKGRKNQQAVLDTVQALKDQRDAQIAASDGSKSATDKIVANYNAQIAALEKVYPWIQGLVDKYQEIPRVVVTDVYIREHTNVQGAYTGAHTGSSGGKEDPSKYAHGGIIGAAAVGGPRSGLTMVNEQGPELLKLPTGTMVYPAANTNQMMAGAGPGRIEIVLTFDPGLSNDFDNMIMKKLRAKKILIPSSAITGRT